ncbi:MAG: 4-hydroxy-tetrahydrodipicolinate reductase [Syntrophomonadaceae bacterium]|jgi:4-hydroxy-tetrahydrodipicolinate reductase|nr:4-hydroxy-tetrahydrodipicolinate reductase [Syntrophomonadaceae bacterium]
MAKELQVVVVGALGKMGRETVKVLKKSDNLILAAAVDVKAGNAKVSDITGDENDCLPIWPDLDEALDSVGVDVVVDFTNPQAVYNNARSVLRRGIPCVVGTSGLNEREIGELEKLAWENRTGIAIIPNFAIGAVLMMRFAEEASRYFAHVEIVELHHDGKLDAPSGTAIKTAEMIDRHRGGVPPSPRGQFEKYPGARGGQVNGVQVHSIRLPGLVAHQEVIFGGQGQTLSIRHDSYNRESFMPGVLLTVEKIMDIKGLVYGLEHLI